ncbi:MAG: protoheme IX farnesyltransferase [Caldilineae bacterium]|nr:MAG: protoheme IX farnesyltransferase [Caldilineae bacterium]
MNTVDRKELLPAGIVTPLPLVERWKAVRAHIPSLKTLMVLFKVRIVILLLWAAVGGAFLAANGWPGWGRLLLLLLTGGLAAGGSGAMNQYFERESDSLMKRTRHRPLVDGTIPRPGWVPYVAGGMIVVPSLLVLPFNPTLTFFLLLGAFIYVGLYTLYLKPRTLLNIVIGGAAGSAAVLSGSAAAGHWNDPGALILSLLLFVWTPTHFWSLAIVHRADYARSSTPMLPVQTTDRVAALWVLLHTAATVFAAIALIFQPALGWIYAVPVGLASLDLLVRNIRLVRTPTPKLAFSLFKVSNIYLTVVMLMVGIDALL